MSRCFHCGTWRKTNRATCYANTVRWETLDAAHIQWHQANGPDIEENGLALCVLHHKTFDLGAYTVNSEGVLLVSDRARGGAGLQETLMRYHGKPIQRSQRPEWNPADHHLDWHAREVFRGAPRHIP